MEVYKGRCPSLPPIHNQRKVQLPTLPTQTGCDYHPCPNLAWPQSLYRQTPPDLGHSQLVTQGMRAEGLLAHGHTPTGDLYHPLRCGLATQTGLQAAWHTAGLEITAAMDMDTYTEGWSHACCLVCSQLLWPKNPQKPEVQHADRLGAMNAPDCLVAQDTDPSQFHTTLPSPHFGAWES